MGTNGAPEPDAPDRFTRARTDNLARTDPCPAKHGIAGPLARHFTRARRSASSPASSGDLLEPAFEEATLAVVADELECASIARGGLRETSEPPLELGARCMKQVIVGKVLFERVDDHERGL